MPRSRWVWDRASGELVDAAEYYARQASAARSHLPAPMLILDGMAPVQSMLDGRIYDSKAALRATYKQAGVVEVGNDSSVTDPKPKPKARPDRKSIGAAVDRALSQTGFGA